MLPYKMQLQQPTPRKTPKINPSDDKPIVPSKAKAKTNAPSAQKPVTVVWNYPWHIKQTVLTFYVNKCKSLKQFQGQVLSSVDCVTSGSDGSHRQTSSKATFNVDSLMEGFSASLGGLLGKSLVRHLFYANSAYREE